MQEGKDRCIHTCYQTARSADTPIPELTWIKRLAGAGAGALWHILRFFPLSHRIKFSPHGWVVTLDLHRNLDSPRTRGGSIAMSLDELQQPREDVDVTVLPHENVLVPVIGENMQFMTAGNYFLKSLVIDDV